MCPHHEYGMLAYSRNPLVGANHVEGIQRLATRLLIADRHLPDEENLLRLGLQSLQR